MKHYRRHGLPAFTAVLMFIAMTFFSACVSQPAVPVNPQVSAIELIQPALGLPDLPIEFIEETAMTNSPDGQWKVAVYKDSQGRMYSVELNTSQVVEIDGRALLSGHATVQPAASLDALRARASAAANAVFPALSSRQGKLTYEEGQKGNYFFFTWRDEYSPTSFNRPFLQLAFAGDGQLFAYYNTLESR